MSVTISANVLVRNEITHVDADVRTMKEACKSDVGLEEGGSSEVTYAR